MIWRETERFVFPAIYWWRETPAALLFGGKSTGAVAKPKSKSSQICYASTSTMHHDHPRRVYKYSYYTTASSHRPSSIIIDHVFLDNEGIHLPRGHRSIRLVSDSVRHSNVPITSSVTVDAPVQGRL